MCWEKGCAVGSLESMPHPIRFLLGWPHTHCADTMVCVCEIVFPSRISEEPHWKAPWGFLVSEETLISQLEGIGITWSPSLSYSLSNTHRHHCRAPSLSRGQQFHHPRKTKPKERPEHKTKGINGVCVCVSHSVVSDSLTPWTQ